MKKKYIVMSIIVFIIVVGFVSYKFLEEKPKNINENKIDVVLEIQKYDIDKRIDLNFLKWFKQKYPEEITKILAALQNNNYNENIWYELTHNTLNVLVDLAKGINQNVKIINTDENIVLSFIGDVSLADNYLVMPEYDKRGKGILGILDEQIVASLKNSTVVVANNEFTVSKRGEALKGKMFTFRASPERLKIYEEMGVDLVTLANNHVYDYGKEAFLDMLDELDKIKMPHIGAGKNLEDASMPYYFIINGRKIAFVNANRSEKNILMPGASDDSPGVLRCYDPTYFSNLIKDVKTTSDYVFALVHWGKEGAHNLEEEQKTSAKLYLEKGADAIIGTHAHVLQGMEFYQNKLIAYNLGNFIFNDKTIETGILKIKIMADGSLKYYFEPALQSKVFTKMLMGEEKSELIKKINSWSINAKINDDGLIETYGL